MKTKDANNASIRLLTLAGSQTENATVGSMRLGMTSKRKWTEILVSVITGFAFVIVSEWADPDVVIRYYWWLALFGVGLTFGIFGRCPILHTSLVNGLGIFVVLFLNMFPWIIDAKIPFWQLFMFFGWFSIFMYVVLTLVVLFGAVIGRVTMRWRMKPANQLPEDTARKLADPQH